MDLTTILFSEAACAWVLVSLLSNNLVAVEGKLQEFCGSQAMRLLSAHTSGTSTSTTGSVVAMSTRGAPAVLSAQESAARQEKLLLQQQQLMRRYGNYQSIPLDEGSAV